jgi:hypothetical protein
MLAATIVGPGHNRILPLMSEFIDQQDGEGKQDCERNAAKRWLLAHGQGSWGCIRYIWAMVFSCQPLAKAVLAACADFLFVCSRITTKRHPHTGER